MKCYNALSQCKQMRLMHKNSLLSNYHTSKHLKTVKLICNQYFPKSIDRQSIINFPYRCNKNSSRSTSLRSSFPLNCRVINSSVLSYKIIYYAPTMLIPYQGLIGDNWVVTWKNNDQLVN